MTSSSVRRQLTNDQRKADDDYVVHCENKFARSTTKAYSRAFRYFLLYSGLFSTGYRSLSDAEITPALLATFRRNMKSAFPGRPLQGIFYSVERTLCSLYPCQMPRPAPPAPRHMGSKSGATVAILYEDLDPVHERPFIDSIRKTSRDHHEYPARKLMGLIKIAQPNLSKLPLEERFSRTVLQPAIFSVLSSLKTDGAYHNLHTVGSALNRFFNTNRFDWLNEAILTHRRRLKPKQPSAPAPTKQYRGKTERLGYADMRQEPFRGQFDRFLPTIETPIERLGSVRLLKVSSRRTIELDIMHLFNARMLAGLGRADDEFKLLFTIPSIDALVAYLDDRLKQRSIAKLIVRLRMTYRRIFKHSDSEVYRYMRMVSISIFKANPRTRPKLNHLDAQQMRTILKGQLDRVAHRWSLVNHPPSTHDVIEFRSYLILAVLLTTGLRIGNTTFLRPQQLKSSGMNPIIVIEAREVKNNIKLSVFLEDWVAEHLDLYMHLPDNLVHDQDRIWRSREGTHLSLDLARRLTREYSLSLFGEELRPHDFRRIFIADLQRSSKICQETVHRSAGHKDPATTFNIYGIDERPDNTTLIITEVPSLLTEA